jgi:3-phenylpropionate/trans-cinnamate dioxygenase ferredoxin reductase component
MDDGHVMIVGAGLGGLRAAERLRAAGHSGPVTLLGAEPHLPYNRPPLSKELLAGAAGLTLAQAHEKVVFRRRASIADVTFRLGQPVVAADLAGGTLSLADGADVAFDGLVIATGLRPRRLSLPRASAVPPPHVLRTLDDSLALRAALMPGTRVAIIGGGFIGCEVAGTALSLGCEVTVIEVDQAPMLRVLGPELATAIQRSHEGAGIRFITGHGVTALEAAPATPGTATPDAITPGTATPAVVLVSDGSRVTADVIIEATGSLPNVEWLADNGLDLSDGVLCGNNLAVAAPEEASWQERVVAVGDVARFPNPLFDSVPRRVEHWSMPTDTARQAAATLHAALTGAPAGGAPFTPLPSFWTDQLDLRLWSYGSPVLGTEMAVAEGDLRHLTDGFIATYQRDGRHVGTVTVNIPPNRHRPLREALLTAALLEESS